MKIIRFEILSGLPPVMGMPSYAIGDHAFDFQIDSLQSDMSICSQPTTSLAIDTLQLEVAVDSARCLYIWGYCPMGMWRRSTLSPPTGLPGSLKADPDESLIPGVSVTLGEAALASVWFDPDTGWFCVGEKEAEPSAEVVEFATRCLAVVANGRLSSLWTQPQNWKDVSAHFLKHDRTASTTGNPA